ncbi:MAG: molybdate-binding protein, partial [Chloroflexi bacterium]
MTKRLLVVVAVMVMAGCSGNGGPQQAPLTVFAASSLKTAFDRIGSRLQSSSHNIPTFSYAGTQTLTSQLTQGAPVDVFASADTAHMTVVQDAGLL